MNSHLAKIICTSCWLQLKNLFEKKIAETKIAEIQPYSKSQYFTAERLFTAACAKACVTITYTNLPFLGPLWTLREPWKQFSRSVTLQKENCKKSPGKRVLYYVFCNEKTQALC